jgi:ATP-dependent Lon protease
MVFQKGFALKRSKWHLTAAPKSILIPMSSGTDSLAVLGELFSKFQTSFYSDSVDAVFKALGVD